MDYKTDIENKIGEALLVIGQQNEIVERALLKRREMEGALDASLKSNLEEMCNALNERNKQASKATNLSEEEKGIIDYVEGGKFKQSLESMPSNVAVEHKKSIEASYDAIRSKFSNGELTVCSYLLPECMGDKALLKLLLPIKFSDRKKAGCLEEILYEFNVTMAEFKAAEEHDGYVQLTLETEKEKANEVCNSLVSKLEKNLYPELTRANIKYGVVVIDKDSILQKKIKEEAVSQQPYTPREALETWRNSLLAEGKDISKKILHDKIYRLLGKKAKTKYFAINCNALGKMQIDREDFDNFVRAFTLEKRGVYLFIERKKEITPQPAPAEKTEKERYTTPEFANIFKRRLESEGIHVPYRNIYCIIHNIKRNKELENRPEITEEAGKTYYEKKSAENFMNLYYIGPGKGKERKYRLTKKPEKWIGISNIIGREVSYEQARNILDISEGSLHKKIRDGELAKKISGFITGESLKKFLRENVKGGGEYRTIWLKKE